MLRRFGLYKRPLVSKLILERDAGGKGFTERLRQIAACILYSDDAEAQFKSMQVARAKREQTTQRRKDAEKAYLERILGKNNMKFNLDNVKNTAMLQHLEMKLRPGKNVCFPE